MAVARPDRAEPSCNGATPLTVVASLLSSLGLNVGLTGGFAKQFYTQGLNKASIVGVTEFAECFMLPSSSFAGAAWA
jgi:hypothetical protein